MDRPDCVNLPSDNLAGEILGWSLIAAFVAGMIAIVTWEVFIGAATVGQVAVGVAIIPGAALVGMVLLRNPGCDHGSFPGCVAGVVNAIDTAGEEEWSAFPWLNGHPSVDLVPKSTYWEFLRYPDAPHGSSPLGAYCLPTTRPSPFIRCYYKSERACRGHTGAVVGGITGAVAGGLIVNVIFTTIITGCATLVLCLLALIAAALIGAVATIIGAFVGGQAGMNTAAPNLPEESSNGTDLRVGDYVTLKGFFTSDNGVLYGFFITETSIHGRSVGTAPFPHTDPDANLQQDDCPVPPPVPN